MKITECPRDAIQGLANPVQTQAKIQYISLLAQAGFPILDAGSFVSPKAVPQMADSTEVFQQLPRQPGQKFLAIVANERGARDAVAQSNVDLLGFPLSLSEQFQQRNTNKSVAEAQEVLFRIGNLAAQAGKACRVYLSMGFGNPYGEPYSPQLLSEFCGALAEQGFRSLALSDTIGAADPELIYQVFRQASQDLPEVELIAHFHSRPDTAYPKIEAAYQGGCRAFDAALRGFGGCPMAKDDLTGNIDTLTLLNFCHQMGLDTGINEEKLQEAVAFSPQVFG